MADNNVLKGYWCFDKTIDVGTGIDFSINYTCTINSTKYKGNRIFTNAALGVLYQYDDNGSNNMTLVYAPGTYSNAWNDDDSQTIFVNDEVEQTEGLLSWLQANATKVEFDYNLEEQSVNEYLYVISNLQTKMQNLIKEQGGTVQHKSLEQYMQSLIDLRKRFVEILASFNIEASESEKMSPAWADKFNDVVINLVKGYNLTDLEIVDDTTITLNNIEAYGVPNIKKLTFNKLQSISGTTNFNGTTADEVWFNVFFGATSQNAMSNAKFKKVHLPVSNQGYSNAYNVNSLFANNKYLQEIYLDIMKELGQSICSGCTSLVKVYAPKANKSHGRIFKGCTSLESIDLPEMVDLSVYDFQGCTKLKNVNLPKVIKLPSYTFNKCTSLEEITLNIIHVDSYAFDGCSTLKNISTPNLNKIEAYGFRNCISLNEIILNDGTMTTLLYNNVFENCSSLVSVVGKISQIQTGCFKGCSLLENIDLSECTQLGDNVFNNCTSLKKIDITNPIELNAGGQFVGCTSLEEANLTGITYWNTNQRSPFQDCTSLTTIDLSNCTYLSGGWTSPFQDCTSLTTIKFDSLDKCSCNYMFQGCSALTEVNFPKLTTDTASYTFKYSNVSIVRYGILTTIRANLFDSATSLTDVYLGAEQVVTLSSTNAFSSATAAKPVTLHVKPDYADSYATATNWSSLIAQGKIIIVGDYSD